MKALTLIQPWGTGIVWWCKDVENRSWAPPAAVLGERIAIHAGKKLDSQALHDLVVAGLAPDVESVPTGAVLGTAVVAGWVHFLTGHASPNLSAADVHAALGSRWRQAGPYGWLMREPRPLRAPVPCRGAQGLWTVPADALAEMERVACHDGGIDSVDLTQER